MDNKLSLHIRNLGLQDYESCFHAMQENIAERIIQKKSDHITQDELWLVEHPSVYTLGQAGDPAHILHANNIPVVKTDRGGQVTWHGEGQLIAYFLFDLLALKWNVRQLVTVAEESICSLIAPYLRENLTVRPRKDAPGVYVFQKTNEADPHHEIQLGKIASLGFKIKRGFTYHGIAINVNANLTAFSTINPCGYEGMTMLNLVDVTHKHVNDESMTMHHLQQQFCEILSKRYKDTPIK